MRGQKRTLLTAGNPFTQVYNREQTDRKLASAISHSRSLTDASSRELVSPLQNIGLNHVVRVRTLAEIHDCNTKFAKTIKATLNRSFSVPPTPVHGSLNSIARKRAFRKIHLENSGISSRISTVKSQYSSDKYMHEYLKSQVYAHCASSSLRERCNKIARDWDKKSKLTVSGDTSNIKSLNV